MKNLALAIIAVMKEVKSIDKSMTVGTGSNSYKGVSDKDVKEAIGEAMQKNGLCILPIGVEAKTQVDRWEETNQYGTKTKQSVFSEVTTKYLLLHESGESVELAGYGHGVDTQDKSAGKCTTYALKNLLLYTFLVPTVKLEDTDKEHSDDKEVPKNPIQPSKEFDKDERPWLTDKAFDAAKKRIEAGEVDVFDKTVAAFRIKKEFKQQLEAAKNKK